MMLTRSESLHRPLTLNWKAALATFLLAVNETTLMAHAPAPGLLSTASVWIMDTKQAMYADPPTTRTSRKLSLKMARGVLSLVG
jgi:hypothetical protein